jgi:hypothetical protein
VTFKKNQNITVNLAPQASSPKLSESAFNNANTSLVEASLVGTDVGRPERPLAVFGKTMLSQTRKIFNTL